MAPGELVLVTGGSGFVAVHCIVALLRQGYRVRTTLRSLKRRDEVLGMLKAGEVSQDVAESVEFEVADLSQDDGWTKACEGCTYVLHVASPFPVSTPKNADELVVPAREGTLRVLRAAKTAGTVKRVVLTSSFAAIANGHPHSRTETFTEADWTNLDSTEVPPYPRSKTVAERAAWDWIAKEGGSVELAVLNPVGIYGPILGKDYAASIELIVRLMNGQLPGVPQVQFGIVDVRDLAELHVKAMTDSKAAGQRFIATSDEPFLSIQDVAKSLKRQLGDRAKKVPTRVIPNFVIRAVGFFDAGVSLIVPELGKQNSATNEKAKKTLEWQPRSAHEAIRASAESLYQVGLVK